MPEATQVTYSHKELTELMLRDRGIQSGHWMILVRFGHTAANVAPPIDDAAAVGLMGPATVSVIIEVGIQRVDQPGPLTVDASKIWGAKSSSRKVAKPAAR